MTCYRTLNVMVIIVAFCLVWSGDIYVTASGTDTKDFENEDPLSIPLISDKGAPLVAMLDTNTINRKIKVYIRTLMRETIQNAVQEQIQDIFKTSFDENSTIDFMRNMTMQGINDILKEQGQVKLLDSIRNEGESNARNSPDDDVMVDNFMYKLQGKCLPGDSDITAEDLKRDTQNILNKMVQLREIVKLNEQVMEEIKWILKLNESGGELLVSRLLIMLTRDVETSGICGTKIAKDCTQLQRYVSHSGVYSINPDQKVKVYCDMATDGGGWTIIQRRFDGYVNFQRNWKDYENGFGNVDGEYWLGNKHIHSLTSSGKYELRIDLTDMSNTKKYAVYKKFIVGDAASKYKLTVGDYNGDAGDQMTYHNGMKFSSTDQNNDEHGGTHCVDNYGPWWHKSCCYSALNRKWNMNLYWRNFRINEAKTSVMMIRKL
ncbi:fibrinogen-like protein 1 [Mytilus edulis]|uniref:fibrinogen-like protein 1 n=1 Tax=Mytilus edulis TaxID=6550 RepID=UPI0039F01EE1